jgi:hypothetical protein
MPLLTIKPGVSSWLECAAGGSGLAAEFSYFAVLASPLLPNGQNRGPGKFRTLERYSVEAGLTVFEKSRSDFFLISFFFIASYDWRGI